MQQGGERETEVRTMADANGWVAWRSIK